MLDLLPSSLRIVDIHSGNKTGYHGLVGSVATRIDAFRAAGIGLGDHVVVAVPTPLPALIDLFALWQLGAAAVLVPPSLTQPESQRVCEATSAALRVGERAIVGIAHMEPAEILKTLDGLPTIPMRPEGDLDVACLVLMTSGTTSAPKGVVHSQRSLRARIALNLAHIGTADLARSLTVLPLHFGHGLIGNTLTPLAAGAHLALWPEPGAGGFSRLGPVIDAHQITFMSSVPAMWRVALRLSPPPAAGSLRRIHVGSAPLATELWEAVAEWAGIRRIVNMYGITETANWIGGFSLEDGPAEDGLVGRPWGGRLAILDETGALRPAGHGEIAVMSPSVMMGYFERPDLTAQALQGGWFATGDSGEIRPDGLLRIVGRRKHEINRAGIKIPAEEIDLLLERHPSIQEACAFPMPDPVAGEMVAAAVVLVDSDGTSPQSIIEWCRKEIRSEAVPSRIYIVETIARTERGKINREQVRAKVLGGGHGDE